MESIDVELEPPEQPASSELKPTVLVAPMTPSDPEINVRLEIMTQ